MLIRNPALPSDEPSKKAKCQYRTKIESYYTGTDARWMWQGLHTITESKGKRIRDPSSDASLPDELNAFYACVGASNTEACIRASAIRDDSDHAFHRECEQDLKTDGLSRRVLRA